MTNLRFFSRSLSLHQQINLQLEQIIKEKQRPTLIRLSNRASVQYVLESGFNRVSEGSKYHVVWNKCLVKILYNDPAVKWFRIEIEKPP